MEAARIQPTMEAADALIRLFFHRSVSTKKTKTEVEFLWCYTVLILFLTIESFSQPLYIDGSMPDECISGYYVVVGSFKVAENAMRFNEFLIQRSYSSAYVYSNRSNIYYVHLGVHQQKEKAINDVTQIRSIPLFSDAWVKYVPNEESIDNSLQDDEIQSSHNVLQTSTEIDTLEYKGKEVDSSTTENIVQYSTMALSNTEIFLSLFNATNDRIVDGKVKVVDSDRSKLLNEVPGNSYLYLPDPKSKSGQLTLISDVFGYRKVQHQLNFNDPLADTLQSFLEVFGTSLLVKFDLVRYQRGDIATLYNVYFYSDAAVMMPESKYELQSLLQMLIENSNYRIRLHGHTNGNYFGKIKGPRDEQNFFSLSDELVTKTGSAKELSFLRAQVIKSYLVQSGIDASRIEVKAWGGKRPIYDKHDANAKRNIRVEVEMLSE